MPGNENILLISLEIFFLWYIFGSILIVRKKGLDPTLVTYINPLRLGNYWVARIWIISIGVLWTINHEVFVCLAITGLLFALMQCLLLFSFNRVATQPAIFYFFIACTIFLTILFSKYSIFIIPPFLLLSEVQLRSWKHSQKKHYDRWVARQVTSIHRQYKHIAVKFQKNEWFYILHFAVTENIARPRLSRLMERVYFYIFRPRQISTGIMQVSSDRPLSDSESMQRGSIIISNSLKSMPAHLSDPSDKLSWIASKYNGSPVNKSVRNGYLPMLYATYPGLNIAWQEINQQ